MRLRGRLDAWRESLFFVPMLYVVGALLFAQATLFADRHLLEPPIAYLLQATVDSARIILSTTASATIGVAGVAFSVSLLLIQLASAQFSPRVLRGFFRDPVSKRAMGLAAGTFAYCLSVLREVRVPDDGGAAVVPYASVLVALGLGLVTLLAILHFISHSAHSMQAGEIIRRIMDETEDQLERICEPLDSHVEPDAPVPAGAGTVIRAPDSGWLQQIALADLDERCPTDGIIRIETYVGLFVTKMTPLCTIWPPPPADEVEAIQHAFLIGRSRTMTQDLAFGIRQLVDIGLRALSPGVNDPTTADEVIVHLGVVMRRLYTSNLPDRVRRLEAGTVIIAKMPDHRGFLGLAFDQLRRAAVTQPSVIATLLTTYGMLLREMQRLELQKRIPDLLELANLTLQGAEANDPLEADRLALRAHASNLGLLQEAPGTL